MILISIRINIKIQQLENMFVFIKKTRHDAASTEQGSNERCVFKRDVTLVICAH